MFRICFFLLLSSIFSKSYGQVICSDQFFFEGSSYFKVDGSVADWTTLFNRAPSLISASQPGPLNNLSNLTFDETCSGQSESDMDQPFPGEDLKFSGFVADINNIYFYLRRATTDGAATIYYFLDINADGFMNNGEPVLEIFFNSNKVVRYSLGKYLVNTEIDYVQGKGNYMFSPLGSAIDGYALKGTVQELFNSKSSEVDNLNADQSFDAAITENGQALEFSIPWEFLKNWNSSSGSLTSGDIFSYHISSKNGGGKYDANKIMDNMSGCCDQLGYIGNLKAELVQSTLTSIVQGTKYRVFLKFVNTTNITETITIPRLELTSQVNSNIESLTSATLTKDLNCDGLSFQEPVSSYTLAFGSLRNSNTAIQLQPGQTACYVIDIEFSQLISSFQIELQPELDGIPFTICYPIFCTPVGEGGRPINPIGFTETPDEVTMRKPIEQAEVKFEEIQIYPNPSNGSITMRLPNQVTNYQVRLQDNLGKTLQTWDIVKTGMTVSGLRSGIYFIQITDLNLKKNVTRKIIVQK